MSPNAFDLPETTIECGVCLMLGEVFEQTVSPLFGDSVVDVVEWSFDMAWELPGLSPWLQETLADFSQRDAVLRHGGQLFLSVRSPIEATAGLAGAIPAPGCGYSDEARFRVFRIYGCRRFSSGCSASRSTERD